MLIIGLNSNKYQYMDSIFSKLNFKAGQILYVLNAPEAFQKLLSTVPAEVSVKQEISNTENVEFVIFFGISKTEIEAQAKQIVPLLKGDAILWLSYPKGTSKKYKCDFNRDTSWDLLKPYNLLPVRQVSIDADWSALRFRKAEYIKSLTRKEKE